MFKLISALPSLVAASPLTYAPLGLPLTEHELIQLEGKGEQAFSRTRGKDLLKGGISRVAPEGLVEIASSVTAFKLPSAVLKRDF